MKFLLSLTLAAVGALATSTSTCVKKKIIIDTDFYNLPDDVNALGIANAFQTWGEVEIVGVISNIRSRFAPPAIDAVDTFYGHPDIPVAILKPIDNSTVDPNFPTFAGWVDILSQKFTEDTNDGLNTTDPVKLYRQLLSSAEDNSITITVIGFFDVLYQLVDSLGDEFSPLTGWELIKRKVKELVVQADGQGRSFNLSYHNGTFAQHVLNNWPTMLTFVPGYLGRNVRMGAKLAVELNPQTNPIAFVWNATIGPGKVDGSWDPAAIYYAARGLDDVYHYNKTGGAVTVFANGSSVWNNSAVPPAPQNWVDLTMSNVTFAERLEDILLWEPGYPVPAGLTRGCYVPPGSPNNSTGGGNGTVPVPTAVPTASGVSEYIGGAGSVVLERSILVGAAVVLAVVLAM